MTTKDLVFELTRIKLNYWREVDSGNCRRMSALPGTADHEIERVMEAAGELLPLGHHKDARYLEDIESGIEEGYDQRREKYLANISCMMREHAPHIQ